MTLMVFVGYRTYPLLRAAFICADSSRETLFPFACPISYIVGTCSLRLLSLRGLKAENFFFGGIGAFLVNSWLVVYGTMWCQVIKWSLEL